MNRSASAAKSGESLQKIETHDNILDGILHCFRFFRALPLPERRQTKLMKGVDEAHRAGMMGRDDCEEQQSASIS